MVQVFLNKQKIADVVNSDYKNIINNIHNSTGLNSVDYFLEQGGKLVTAKGSLIKKEWPVYCVLRLKAGKGGFGSMLRAIGAQIEKTTNREACRDLSGRRLRDINEEKRLLSWIEKQEEREREAGERKKKKIEKLLAKPKHEFKDKKYEEAREKLAEKVNDAVEEGIKKQIINDTGAACSSGLATKRKHECSKKKKKCKKAKDAFWIDDDLSDTSDDRSSDERDMEENSKKILQNHAES